METIQDTVKNVMRALKTKKKGLRDIDDLEVLMKKTFSLKELTHIKFNYFRKGILSINVDSSSWLYHLNLKKEALLAKFSKKLSNIKDVRWRLGEMK